MDNITKYILEQEEIKILIEDVIKDVNEVKFYNLQKQPALSLSPGETKVAALVVAAAIAYGAYKIAKGLAKRMEPKKCRQYKTGSPAGRKCHNEVMIVSLNKQIEIMKSKMNLCAHSKDPGKCKAKLNKKIAELKQKISEKQARIRELESQV